MYLEFPMTHSAVNEVPTVSSRDLGSIC